MTSTESGRTSAEMAAIRERIAQVPAWYHRFDFGDGLTTPGVNDSARIRALLDIPANCAGMRVLDLGTRDGYFAFAERGAEVVAVDYMPRDETGFVVAADILGLRNVAYVQENLYHLTPERFGTFDVVLFLGLLYHLPDMLGALTIVRALARGTAYVETQVIDDALLHPDGTFITGVNPSHQTNGQVNLSPPWPMPLRTRPAAHSRGSNAAASCYTPLR